jgi:hypothetical protein
MADLFTPLRLGSLELSNRIWMGPLNALDPASFYSLGPIGYTDYPTLEPQP